MDYTFGDFLDSYARAFDRKDMNSILEHFHYPCLVLEGQKVTACNNKEELKPLVSRKFRYITASGVDQQTSYDVKTLLPWEDFSLILSLDWITQNRAGQQIAKFHCNYHLLKKDNSFKIVIASLPEEKN